MQNTDLFSKLYKEYNKLAYSIAFRKLNNKELAEECVQETFLIVVKKLELFKSLDENHRRNLICTIARGKAVDIVRKEGTIEYIENLSDIDNSVIENYDSLEIGEEIKKLSEIEQTYIFLKYSYGFTNTEIAEMYGISASYVGRVIKKALIEIKTNLEGKQ